MRCAEMEYLCGGSVSTEMVVTVKVTVSELALKFGPAEYFSLMVLGLIGATILARGSLLKAIGMVVLGLLLGLVAQIVTSAFIRSPSAFLDCQDGIGSVSVPWGMFDFAEWSTIVAIMDS